MSKPPEIIYLIKMDEDGYVWCDTPFPSDGVDQTDVTRYIKADNPLINENKLAQSNEQGE